jgi:PTS system beta-glucosides-specific IIC component
LICFVVIVPLTLIVIGPITTWAAMGVANGYNALFHAAPAAAAVIGGVWQIIVIFGVHWGITPVIMANFDTQGTTLSRLTRPLRLSVRWRRCLACS